MNKSKPITGLTNLVELDLSSNRIIKDDSNIKINKIKNSYSGLTNLVELDLSSNLLTAVPTPTFSGGQKIYRKE